MPKSSYPLLLAGSTLLAASSAHALPAPAGAASGCISGKPSVLVRIVGFKQARGQVKVSLYGSQNWLAKAGRIGRVEVPVNGSPMDICMPVPTPGRYAVAVHHDFNLNGNRDRHDGGGYSGNPKVSLVNPRPPFTKASFSVGNGPAQVGVTLLYIKGLSVGPAGS